MMRWIEEYELKHVEFQRCIKSFRTMAGIWATLGDKSADPGRAAFARRQSTVYRELQTDAERLYHLKGLEEFVKCDPDDLETLLRTVREFRRKELGWLMELAKVSETDAGERLT